MRLGPSTHHNQQHRSTSLRNSSIKQLESCYHYPRCSYPSTTTPLSLYGTPRTVSLSEALLSVIKLWLLATVNIDKYITLKFVTADHPHIWHSSTFPAAHPITTDFFSLSIDVIQFKAKETSRSYLCALLVKNQVESFSFSTGILPLADLLTTGVRVSTTGENCVSVVLFTDEMRQLLIYNATEVTH